MATLSSLLRRIITYRAIASLLIVSILFVQIAKPKDASAYNPYLIAARLAAGALGIYYWWTHREGASCTPKGGAEDSGEIDKEGICSPCTTSYEYSEEEHDYVVIKHCKSKAFTPWRVSERVGAINTIGTVNVTFAQAFGEIGLDILDLSIQSKKAKNIDPIQKFAAKTYVDTAVKLISQAEEYLPDYYDSIDSWRETGSPPPILLNAKWANLANKVDSSRKLISKAAKALKMKIKKRGVISLPEEIASPFRSVRTNTVVLEKEGGAVTLNVYAENGVDPSSIKAILKSGNKTISESLLTPTGSSSSTTIFEGEISAPPAKSSVDSYTISIEGKNEGGEVIPFPGLLERPLYVGKGLKGVFK